MPTESDHSVRLPTDSDPTFGCSCGPTFDTWKDALAHMMAEHGWSPAEGVEW